MHGAWENTDDGALSAINFGVARTVYDVDVKNRFDRNFALDAQRGMMDISSLEYTMIPGSIGFDVIPQFSADEFIALVDAQGLRGPTTLAENGIEEETLSAYVSFDFDTTFNGKDFHANIGVRYEETDIDAYSVVDPVVALNWITPLRMDTLRLGEQQAEMLAGSYDHFLPNMDFSLEVAEDVVVRLSYSNTVARPSIESMFPATRLNTITVGGGPFIASQGNPNLLPYESDNVDLSVEWYYGEGSYFSLGYFSKAVDNFTAQASEDRIIEGPNGPLTDPSANPRGACPAGTETNPDPDCVSQPGDPVITWEVNTTLNLEESEVDGWEFNVQHMLGDTGFGGILNYTAVESSDSFDVFSLDNDYNVPGLSDSANVVLFYEKDRLQARLAYNWRDKFVLRVLGGGEPRFTAEYSQLDMSVSYDVTDSINVFVEGINITDEETWRHGRWENQIYDYETYGPRYTIGARVAF